MGYKSVIIRNFERILRGENPVVFGDGEQKLDYIYVDDVVAITIRALESAHTNEIFNVGTSIPVSINQLTDKMIALSQKPLQKTYGDRDLTHGSFRVSNTTKIYKELGFQPEVTLEEGLAKTYKWMREVNP
jgi:UDP-glucose 4-epimerase